jgi:hypothetical protein
LIQRNDRASGSAHSRAADREAEMKAPHLTTIAAALMTGGGAVWAAAMSSSREVIGGVVCGLHPAATAGAHCGLCYAAMLAAGTGAALLATAAVRALAPAARR